MCRLLLAVALPLAVLAAPVAGQDEDSPAVKKAKALVEKQAENVVRFAHPPAKFKAAAFDGFSKLADGFDLVYTFTLDGPLRSGLTTKLRFTFDKAGRLDFITFKEGDTTARHPFTQDVTAKKLGELKEQVRGLKPVRDDRKLLREVEEAKDSKVLLEVWLRNATAS